MFLEDWWYPGDITVYSMYSYVWNDNTMFDRVDYVLISMCGATYVKWCMTGRVTFQRTSAVAGFVAPGILKPN